MSADLALTADGDLTTTHALVTGVDLVLQRVSRRLRTFRGDWILDSTKGLPIIEWMQTKPPPVAEVVAFIRREVATTPGVNRVVSMSGSYARATRRITITGEITVDDEPDPVVLTIAGLAPDAPNGQPFLLLLGKSGAIVP